MPFPRRKIHVSCTLNVQGGSYAAISVLSYTPVMSQKVEIYGKCQLSHPHENLKHEIMLT